MNPQPAGKPESWHLVPLLYLASMGVLLYGTATSPWPYTDPRFVTGFFGVQVAVLVLLLPTFLLVPAWKVGLRRPALVDGGLVVPMAVMLGASFAAWLAARLTLPAGAVVDRSMALGILRTTALVGVTEEWVYRGLVFAFLARWLGLRRGAYLALLLFGVLHLLNMAAGVPPGVAAVQFVSTMVIGATLLLGAVGTRSLLPAMLVHGVYDALVIDGGRYREAGAPAWTGLVGLVPTVVVGIYAFARIRSLRGQVPYPAGDEPAA
jgi:membrane protease YdiL (CAAX protease family)